MDTSLIGKKDKKAKRPAPWMIGAIASGILIATGGTAFVINRATPKIDLAKLTVPVQGQNLTVRITASGSVVPIQSVNLSPKTGGRIAKLYVEQGDRVEKGQKIALMENADLQAQYYQAKANYAKALASYQESQAGSRPEEIAQSQARVLQAQARLDEARVGTGPDVDQARAQVETARSRLALARVRANRYRSLSGQGAVTLDQRDEAITEERNANAALFEAEQGLQKVRVGNSPEIAQLQAAVFEARANLQQLQNGNRSEAIAQAKASVEAARAQVLSAQVQLQDTEIVAPFAGIVTQKYATEGAFVTPTTTASSSASATSTSIVAIAKGAEILAKVPEVDVGQIKIGQPVDVVADAYPDRVFKGKVARIAPEAIVDQNVTSFQVRVTLVTGQKELLSGMNVDLNFLGQQLNNTLAVPTVAIVTEKGETGVMVPGKDNKPVFKKVKIGQSIQDKTQILEGVNPGDRVFIDLPEDVRRQKAQEQ